MTDLSVKFNKSINLIIRHYQRHSERINQLNREQNFSIEYFIHFYRVLLMKEIQLIFDMDDSEFSLLAQTTEFQSKIIALLDKTIMILANNALDARLYPPKQTSHKP
ncbi:hypothetical protein [Shewanella baltica]|uniref:hypothetical protein n=1 Tax=Shewanella baltica TaxID=62322 RepID=UPI003D7B3CB4